MAFRIEIGLKRGVPDARGRAVVSKARDFLSLPITSCHTRDVYQVDVPLKPTQQRHLRDAFTDPVTAKAKVGRLAPPAFHWMVEVGFKPGVTDNVGHTAKALVEDLLGRKLDGNEGVYTATQYFLKGPQLTHRDAEHLGFDLLANRLIQTVRIFSPDEWKASPINNEVPAIRDPNIIDVKTYDLSGTDEDLERISSKGILSLSLAEMKTIRDHFRDPALRTAREQLGLPNDPTDVELECIAQTWSEHCKHKIFAGDIHYEDDEGNQSVIHSLFKTFIKASTEEVGNHVDWLVSVFSDNAGIIKFNDTYNLAFKAETHNSPSALDPYGGSITGIVGCNRDPMGTGMGCELIANTWGYCLASPFYEGEIPEGLFHPRRIRDGVHEGVIDGGNQSGIPWARGFEVFDDRFLGKPLVYCGTVGRIPIQTEGRPSERKEIMPGDAVVMVGGRIGKDGIHGATFSSEELREESPAQAVQIGDPITQRMMYEFIMEARDLGLFRAITDNGAGGLSSSIGEMSQLCGGAEVDLALAPLKYPGLQPWEIFISESQERMSLAVQPEKIDALLELAEKRDVEATVLGRFCDSGHLLLKYGDQVVANLNMDFLHEGCPTMVMTAKWSPPTFPAPRKPRKGSRNILLKKLLSSLNICSREFKSRSYDGEVKGLSILKPFTGVRSDVPSDATVMRVSYDEHDGIVLSDGINPFYSDLDTYAMMASIIDLAVRRIISVGGSMDRMAGLDNFCWPDPVQSEKTPDGHYKMAQLVRANQALYDVTTAYRVPCISGKDSMKNDSVRGGRKISIPPTVLFSAIGIMEDVRQSVSMYFKQPGDCIYVIGLTKKELGASAFYRLLSAEQKVDQHLGSNPPSLDIPMAVDLYRQMNKAVAAELLHSSHTPHLGGLGVGLALAAIGGDLGAEIDLDLIPAEGELEPDEILFSESNSRFIVTCSPEKALELERLFSGLPISRIGTVEKNPTLMMKQESGKPLVNESIEVLRKAFKEPLHGV